MVHDNNHIFIFCSEQNGEYKLNRINTFWQWRNTHNEIRHTLSFKYYSDAEALYPDIS